MYKGVKLCGEVTRMWFYLTHTCTFYAVLFVSVPQCMYSSVYIWGLEVYNIRWDTCSALFYIRLTFSCFKVLSLVGWQMVYTKRLTSVPNYSLTNILVWHMYTNGRCKLGQKALSPLPPPLTLFSSFPSFFLSFLFSLSFLPPSFFSFLPSFSPFSPSPLLLSQTHIEPSSFSRSTGNIYHCQKTSSSTMPWQRPLSQSGHDSSKLSLVRRTVCSLLPHVCLSVYVSVYYTVMCCLVISVTGHI